MSYIKLYCTGVALADPNNPDTNYSGAEKYLISGMGGNNKILCLKFEDVDLTLFRRKSIWIYEFACLLGRYGQTSDVNIGSASMVFCDDRIDDIEDVTYNNMPHVYNQTSLLSIPVKTTAAVATWSYSSGSSVNAASIRNLLQNAAIRISGINSIDYQVYFYTGTDLESRRPYFNIYVGSNVAFYVDGTAHTSGEIDPADSNTFSWIWYSGSTSYIDPIEDHSTFYWKSIEDDVVHSVTVQGDANSVTIPANTFPTTGIEWWASVTDTDGVTDTSQHYRNKTGDYAAKPAPQSPANSAYANPRATIKFQWTFSDSATVRKNIELQYSYDGQTWATLVQNLPAGTTSYTAPANTLNVAATVYWRVRAYNADDVQGPWSSTANFTTSAPLSTATITSPKGGVYLNEKSEITFQWAASNPSGYTPEKSELQWKTSNGEWTSLAVVTGNARTFTAPANTFPSAIISWRVRAYNVDDIAGAWSSEANFTTEDELTVVTAQYPSSIYINRAQSLSFRWTARNTTSAITGFDLQYDANDGQGWQTFATIRNSNATTYTAPANTFPASTQINWRVRGYNDDNVPGSWSSLSFATIDSTTTATAVSPKNGISADETKSILFSWTTANQLGSKPSGAELQWTTVSGAHEADYVALGRVTGTATTFTAPANTFPGSAIYWRVRAINQSGVAGPWSYADFTTLDAPSVSVPSSPSGTIENADDAILFIWTTSSSSGTAPTRADVQYKYEDGEWADLGTTDGAQHLTVPGGVIDAGTVYWRVRSYNRNGYAGSWSSPASFAAYAAPKIRGVFADSMPFATITWQVDGQVAYNIRVDTKNYGPYFGAGVRTFVLPEPLAAGTHIAGLRAQNEFGLWSKWNEVSFVTASGISDLVLTGDSGQDISLSWVGGDVEPPIITVQPVSMSALDGLICFAVNAQGAGISYSWEMKLPNSAAWQSVGGGTNGQIWTHEASADYNGARFRCRVSSAAGSVLSNEAVYTYALPIAAPSITVQPENVKKKAGTVRIWCGATGSSYRWYRCTEQSGEAEDPDAIPVSDGEGGIWRISSASGTASDINITGIGGGVWHIPAGEGEVGTIAIVDDGFGQWYLPSGSGSPDFSDTGVTTPYISFAASSEKSGNRFFCLVSNAAGSISSDIVEYTYDDPETPEQSGDYYIYRDDTLIARTPRSIFADRVVLGQHSYQVIKRFDNNNVARSNIVTAVASVETLTIGPLSAGDWISLPRTDRSSRELNQTRHRETAFLMISGAKYPMAEVGEHEDLSVSFDVAFSRNDEVTAKAFEALIGESVILKSKNDAIIIGILEGWQRKDKYFYRNYSCTIRQVEWRDYVDET